MKIGGFHSVAEILNENLPRPLSPFHEEGFALKVNKRGEVRTSNGI